MAHLKRELCSWGFAILVACFIVNFVTDGVKFSFGILFEVFTDTFGKDAKTTAWIGSMLFSVMNFGGPVGSLCVRKFGCRIATVTGSLLCFVGCILSAFIPNLYFLYFSLGILVGFGMSLMYVAQTVIVLRYFKNNRTFAVGLSICGSGLGGSTMAFLLNILDDLYSWSSLMLILSGILLQTTVAGMMMRPKKEPTQEHFNFKCEEALLEDDLKSINEIKLKSLDYDVDSIESNEKRAQIEDMSKSYVDAEQKLEEAKCCNQSDVAEQVSTKSKLEKDQNISKLSDEVANIENNDLKIVSSSQREIQLSATCQTDNDIQTAPKDKTSSLSIYKELLKDSKVILFLSPQIFISLAIMIPFTFIPRVAMDKAYSDYRSVWLLSSVNIANIVCRLLIGLIADRKFVNRSYLYTFAILILPIAGMGYFLTDDYTVLMVSSCLLGLGFGGMLTLFPVVMTEFFGEQRVSEMFGLCIFCRGPSYLLGSPIAGYIIDVADTSSYVFLLFTGLMVTATILTVSVVYMHARRTK